jgi:spore coat polysaccharide biosynthesis protein SpsF
MSKPRIVATIEARMGSSRLPGKVLMPAGGKPMLQILIERLRRARQVDDIVVATTVNPGDAPIVELAESLGTSVHRGSEDDVLGRVHGALVECAADICVEITGDCPLIDPGIVDEAISAYLETAGTHPYVSNSDPHRAVPAGLDVQVFAASALARLAAETDSPDDREHVSLGFYREDAARHWNPRFIRHAATEGAEGLLVTLDYQEDYVLLRALHEDVSRSCANYGAREIIEWVRAHRDLEDACRRVRGLEVRP